MINPLLGRLMKEKKEDVVHTSAFAEAQNRGGFGSTSTESFERRREIDQQRTLVGGYRDARVVSDRGVEAWRIKQEMRQLGEDGSSASRNDGRAGGGLGVRGGAAVRNKPGDLNKGVAGSKGAAGLRPPARKNPGISR